MKKKMAIAGITLATMLICSNAYAEDTLQYGQETEVQTDSGSYKVTVDKIVETDQFNDDSQSAKVVCVDCVIENIDYKNHDHPLSAYNVGTGELALLDSEGISAEFFDVATTSEDGYEFSADIKPGEKKRVALPFLVPENTEKVTVKIDSKYTIDKSFSEESNDISTVEDNSDIEERLSTLEENTKKLEEKNEELESQYNDLKDENEKLKKQNKKLKKQVKELQVSQNENSEEIVTQEKMPSIESSEEGYGVVSGTITYNNGTADINSMVILLPKDGSAKDKTIELPAGYMLNNVDKVDGLSSGKVGGTGEFSITHVPDGEYSMLVVSGNASTESWFEAEKEDHSDYYEKVSQELLEEISAESAYNLSAGMVWYKHHIGDIVVYTDEETIFNYDFGKSYM